MLRAPVRGVGDAAPYEQVRKNFVEADQRAYPFTEQEGYPVPLRSTAQVVRPYGWCRTRYVHRTAG